MRINAQEAMLKINKVAKRVVVPHLLDYCSPRSLDDVFDLLEQEDCKYYQYEDSPEMREVLANCGNFLYDRMSGVVFTDLGGFHTDLSWVLFSLYAPDIGSGIDCAEEFLLAGYGFYQSSCSFAVISDAAHPLTHQEKYMFVKSNPDRRVTTSSAFGWDE